jgi:hypothetical protein
MKRLSMCLVLAACSGGLPHEQETLDDVVRSFNESVKWERFDRAAARLPVKQRAQAVDEWDERSKDVKITEWELVKIDPHGKEEMRAQVKLSWYRESEQILRQTQEIQTWEHHGKTWVLVDEKHLRGPEMPGIPADAPK